jgi:uncharacterized protein with HEPN domain
MSDQPQREWRFYVADMLRFARTVQHYAGGLNQSGFIANTLVYDATLRNLELLGEAATHVPDAVRAAHQAVPWRLVIATRNRLIHGYLGIDDDTVWSIIEDDIPALITALEELQSKDKGSDGA